MTDRGTSIPHVLIFDSGVGGLSILGEIRARQPGLRLTYASDNAAFPYGTKSAEELVPRVEDVLTRLQERYAPDVLVIACNTASTVALPRLRARIPRPVVGVVPAIKPAAARTRSGVIGLLATPATVERPYTQELIAEFAAHCTVLRVGSSDLVELAEAKLRGERIDLGAIERITAPMFRGRDGAALDTVVLACTHFPLLRDELAEVAPRPVAWIDSGEAIARRVAALLHPHGMTGDDQPSLPRQPFLPPSPPHHRAVFTGRGAAVEALVPVLARLGLSGPEYL